MAKVMILVSPLICRSGLAANWSPLNTKKKISVFLFSFEKERCKKKKQKRENTGSDGSNQDQGHRLS